MPAESRLSNDDCHFNNYSLVPQFILAGQKLYVVLI
jgi:hypothetical protein